jgi:hypothetical protein
MRLRIQIDGAQNDLLELAAPEHELRVHLIAQLNDGIGDLDACSSREGLQLGEARTRAIPRAGGAAAADVHEDRPAVLGDLPRTAATRKLLFE